MKRALIVYATREGHTRKIADHVAATMRARGREVDVIDAARTPPDLDFARYGLVVLAASLHMGKHERELIAFAKGHHCDLERVPTALLSVSLSEATVEDPTRPLTTRAEAAKAIKATIDRFLGETELRPAWVMPVAGALPYSAYGWVTRLVMRHISKMEGGPTDTSRDYEMTDWVSLEKFVEELAQTLAPAADGTVHAPDM
jgi:menaquinone-dependent protoporphyrinogen oxidase